MFLLDGITFGTVDFSQIWAVTSAMVQALAVPIVMVVGVNVASVAVRLIAGAINDGEDDEDDAEAIVLDHLDGIDGLSEPIRLSDSALGARDVDLDSFLNDQDEAVANYDRFSSDELIADSGNDGDLVAYDLRTVAERQHDERMDAIGLGTSATLTDWFFSTPEEVESVHAMNTDFRDIWGSGWTPPDEA